MMRYTKRGNESVILARVISTVAALFWSFMLIGQLLGGDDPYATESSVWQGIILVMLMAGAVGATVHGWRDARRASVPLLVSGALLMLFAHITAGRNHLFAMAVSGAPFFISGVLYQIALRSNE